MTAVMIFAVALGSELVILPRFRPSDVLRTIKRHRITLLLGVPALFQALLDCPAARGADFSSLRVCVSGGDSLSGVLAERFTAATGVKLAEGYGLTECSPVVTCTNPLAHIARLGSCGVPLPGTDLAIMSAEPSGRILPYGEIGEICVRGPQVMRGYWRLPEATGKALRDGWLHTGDLGRLDQDGYLYFVNRRSEVIAVQGYKVYARIVEEAIRLHPAVSEVAVVGLPDRIRGEVPKACVVLQPGMTLDEVTLRRFLADKLSPVEVPRVVEFRQSLPKSPFGKVLKQELSQPFHGK
jgi:long-chain acyl-CoA synthetase